MEINFILSVPECNQARQISCKANFNVQRKIKIFKMAISELSDDVVIGDFLRNIELFDCSLNRREIIVFVVDDY